MNGDAKPTTNWGIIFVVVVTLAINGTITVGVLGYCMVMKIEPPAVLLTPYVGLATFILGAISGMLAKTSATEATTAMPISSAGPAPVTIEQPPNTPVPVEEVSTPPRAEVTTNP